MMRFPVFAALLTLLVANVPSLAGEELVRFSGDGSTETQDFEVQGPWILDWRVNTDFPKSMSIEISLINADTGYRDGLILQTKYRGNGVKLFNESGRYWFRVNSTLTNWRLRVEELSVEEAALYTPRRDN